MDSVHLRWCAKVESYKLRDGRIVAQRFAARVQVRPAWGSIHRCRVCQRETLGFNGCQVGAPAFLTSHGTCPLSGRSSLCSFHSILSGDFLGWPGQKTNTDWEFRFDVFTLEFEFPADPWPASGPRTFQNSIRGIQKVEKIKNPDSRDPWSGLDQALEIPKMQKREFEIQVKFEFPAGCWPASGP